MRSKKVLLHTIFMIRTNSCHVSSQFSQRQRNIDSLAGKIEDCFFNTMTFSMLQMTNHNSSVDTRVYG